MLFGRLYNLFDVLNRVAFNDRSSYYRKTFIICNFWEISITHNSFLILFILSTSYAWAKYFEERETAHTHDTNTFQSLINVEQHQDMPTHIVEELSIFLHNSSLGCQLTVETGLRLRFGGVSFSAVPENESNEWKFVENTKQTNSSENNNSSMIQ